jgi:ABC-type proline/glycine betaine transport system ATPase subunit
VIEAETFVLSGASGSGKTNVLKMINRSWIECPEIGEATYSGEAE